MIRLLRHLAHESHVHAGLTAECWCTTGEDLGFGLDSGYGHLIANVHPRCRDHHDVTLPHAWTGGGS